jgi:hypothetical protein
MVRKISKRPGTPEKIRSPSINAMPIIIMDWTITTSKSVANLSSRIAGRLTWVKSIFWRNPRFTSFTIDMPDWNEPMTAFITRIPGVRYVR